MSVEISMADTTCANCGASGVRRHCPDCGQPSKSPRGPLRDLGVELVTTLFSLDSRLLRTLPVLFLRPGRLTRDFLAGHRASQVPPLRMYFLASLMFFLLFQHPAPDARSTQIWLGDELIHEPADGEGGIAISLADVGDPEQREKLIRMDPQVLIDSLFRGIENAIPSALFLFLPLLAAVMKVLFWRRRGFYFDHLIAALHFQTFLFLVLSAAYLFRLTKLFPLAIGLVVMLVAPVYLAVALRTMWEEPWLPLVVKTAFLWISYIVLAALVYLGTMILIMINL